MNHSISLLEVLPKFLTILWKTWPVDDMKAKTLPGNPSEHKFSLSGTCPHCEKPTVFLMVTPVHADTTIGPQNQITHVTLWAVMQCQGCLQYILGCARKYGPPSNVPVSYTYVEHYPIGKPPSDVAPEIPQNIGADFREALRCRFVDAYNATVEMCRRAVQASCIQLSAPATEKLVKQIDWLAAQGLITTPLKEMAHRVRLGGNLGAHPPEDPNDPTAITIDDQYADAVIEFTRDFFQHIYVMPERLKKFTFKK